MQNLSYLLSVCNTIHKTGKTPTVALIRQYSERAVGIPEIVKAIQRWKTNPTPTEATMTSPTSDTKKNLEERVVYLEQQVALLSAQLNKLSSTTLQGN